jgi:solute carrier family 25 thiamine pyrophosphate transporter 19
MAGLLSRFVVSPIDVVKIRLQLDTSRVQLGGQPLVWKTAKQILANEGVTAFWNGNVPAELMYVFYGATQFSAYKVANDVCRREMPNAPEQARLFVSGAAAGCFATLASYPLDLLRTRLAADPNRPLRKRLGATMSRILAQEGYKGFYRGLKPAIVSIVPSMGVFFVTYEETRGIMRLSPSLDLLPAPEVMAGFVAGALSKASVFPLDVIRKRLQVQGVTGRPTYPTSIFGCATKIIVNEGIRGLYKGFLVSLLKTAPASAVTMFFFEKSITTIRWFQRASQTLSP